MEKTIGAWSIGLHCKCPGCMEDVNICEDLEFLSELPSNIIGTILTIESTCPSCKKEFLVQTI